MDEVTVVLFVVGSWSMSDELVDEVDSVAADVGSEVDNVVVVLSYEAWMTVRSSCDGVGWAAGGVAGCCRGLVVESS